MLCYADSIAELGIEAPSATDYVSLGFPSKKGEMINSAAVIATESTGVGGFGVYMLVGKKPSSVSSTGTLGPTKGGILKVRGQ